MQLPFGTAALEASTAIVKHAHTHSGLEYRARSYHTSPALQDMGASHRADAALRWANDAGREAVKQGVLALEDLTPHALLMAAANMIASKSEYVK